MQIPYKFSPRAYQLPIFRAIDNGFKRIIQVWHRRAGKEKTDVNIVAKKLFEKVGAYYYIFPHITKEKRFFGTGQIRKERAFWIISRRKHCYEQ